MRVREVDQGKGKAITSKDPRKAGIVAAFKRLVPGCTKVTQVIETKDGLYQAICLGRGERPRSYSRLGPYELDMSDG